MSPRCARSGCGAEPCRGCSDVISAGGCEVLTQPSRSLAEKIGLGPEARVLTFFCRIRLPRTHTDTDEIVGWFPEVQTKLQISHRLADYRLTILLIYKGILTYTYGGPVWFPFF
jgi:hypothetical protein